MREGAYVWSPVCSEAMIDPSNEITAPEAPKGLLPSPGTVQGETPKQPPASPPKSRSRLWLWVVVLLALIAAAFFWSRAHKPTATQTTAGAKGKRGAGGVTPVVAVRATKGNIGVYVTGLGAITPIYSVTIKSRVDGQLMKVYFKEGDLVRAGDPLVEIDPRPYEAAVVQTQGALSRDQALLENARVDLNRYTTLLAENAIPEQQLATQKALVQQYEGVVKNDQGLLDMAKLNVVYCHITSPITGMVGLRLVDPGNIVQTSDATGMLVINQIQPISVIFTISEDQLPPILQKIHAGQRLPVDAWDRENTHKLASGVLSTLDNAIDQTTGTLKLRAIFNNGNRTLFPNQFVNARLLQQEKTGVTLIASAAVQRNTNNTYVYLVKPDSTVTLRNIDLGTTEGDESQVTSGLVPGDVVVMTGVDKLQEGSKVAVTMASGNK